LLIPLESFPSDFPQVLSAVLATIGGPVAKPNYQFEKRQRDLAKKSKQEEKRRQKQAEKPGGSSGEGEAANPPTAPSHERT
jgi:hypothetical protein